MGIQKNLKETLAELNRLNPLNLFSVPKIFKAPDKEAGLPPGTLVYIGEKKAERISITLFDYDGEHIETREVEKIDECFPYREKTSKTWINVVGLHDVKLIEQLGTKFGIHPLVLEDILNTRQRPKIEDFGDYVYIVLKMIFRDKSTGEIISEQISIIVGENYVITFQEAEGDVFDPIRQRMKNPRGRFRTHGIDYLAYALIDILVDNYLLVVEEIGEKIEDMEERILHDAGKHDLEIIQSFKRNMIFLRRSIWPVREVMGELVKSESDIITESTAVFFRDVQDHAVQVIDSIEMFREMLSGMLDMHVSSMSNRMNEVMKVLTIIATIFIPLTFIAGIYGMNFENMPELKYPGGYFAALGVMFSIFIMMLIYFRRKKWL